MKYFILLLCLLCLNGCGYNSRYEEGFERGRASTIPFNREMPKETVICPTGKKVKAFRVYEIDQDGHREILYETCFPYPLLIKGKLFIEPIFEVKE